MSLALAGYGQRRAARDEQGGIVGCDRDGLVQPGDRIRLPVQALQHIGRLVEHVGIVGLDGERAVEGGESFGIAVQEGQGSPYLAQPPRSLQRACTDIARCEGKAQPCPDCPLGELCPAASPPATEGAARRRSA